MTAVEFGDLPPETTGRPRKHDWTTIAAELRARPGEWARVVIKANGGFATQLTQGRYVDFRPAGSFEAVIRAAGKDETTNRRQFDTWARYVGGEQS